MPLVSGENDDKKMTMAMTMLMVMRMNMVSSRVDDQDVRV